MKKILELFRWASFVGLVSLPGALAVACTSATDPGATSTSDGGDGGGDAATTTGDGAANPDGGAVSEVTFRINELFGERDSSGGDWMEIYNVGTAAADVSGFRLLDVGVDGGPLKNTFAFPPHTSIPAGGYIVVMGKQPDGGPFCAVPAPASCFFASFGLDRNGGEALALSSPAGKILERVNYPGNLGSSQAWGRLADGIGSFQTVRSTPGAPNKP